MKTLRRSRLCELIENWFRDCLADLTDRRLSTLARFVQKYRFSSWLVNDWLIVANLNILCEFPQFVSFWKSWCLLVTGRNLQVCALLRTRLRWVSILSAVLRCWMRLYDVRHSFFREGVSDSVGCFSRLHVTLDRTKAVRVSGMSEKAYVRSLTAMQNALGLRWVVASWLSEYCLGNSNAPSASMSSHLNSTVSWSSWFSWVVVCNRRLVVD